MKILKSNYPKSINKNKKEIREFFLRYLRYKIPEKTRHNEDR